MHNPNNLLRSPILNPNNAVNNNANDAAPAQLDQGELVNLISRIAREVVNTQAPAIVQSTLNPNASLANVTDQVIDAEYANNLSDLDKIPDVAKCLREFSGNPEEFNSWRKSVDRILSIYESKKGTPKYYGILNVIRNKIIGSADAVLESYNTPLDWSAICKCLTLHYADKRDVSTLEYQMTSLVQGRQSIEEFYQAVYANLSLILNKIGCMEVGSEALNLLTHTYRNKALDTFVRGLNGDMPRLLGMKEPVDLPQALHLCLKLENQGYHTQYVHNSNNNNFSRKSMQQNILPLRIQRNSQTQPNQQNFYPQIAYSPQPQQTFSRPYTNPFRNPPMRPQGPKPQPPAEPIEVYATMHSRRINYMNQPQVNRYPSKRPTHAEQNFLPQKAQRSFHIATAPCTSFGNYAHEASEQAEQLYEYGNVANEACEEAEQFYEYGSVHFLN